MRVQLVLFLLQFEAFIVLMKSSDLRIALYTRIVQNHLGTHHSSLVVSKTKHSKTKTEARSTQISKTKHPKLETTVGLITATLRLA